MQLQLIYNAIRTPDGTVLESRYIHDFKSHKDKLTGEVYIVDGGMAYLRRSSNKVKAEELSVYREDSFDKIRSVPIWRSFGKEDKGPERFLSLDQMSINHIKTILDTQPHIGSWLREMFIKELELRGVAYE